MRNVSLFLSFMLCFVLCLLTSQALAAVTVENVSAEQIDGTLTVEIFYDLKSDIPGHMNVEVVIKDDENELNAPSLSGDLGLVSTGSDKRIVWNAGNDWPENASSEMEFIVQADMPEGGDNTAVAWRVLSDQWIKNIYNDGSITITDRISGLMWKEPAKEGDDIVNMEAANEAAEDLDYAGYQDWSLPDKDQLQPMYAHRGFFSDVQDSYWSSSISNNNGYYLDMRDGVLKTSRVTGRHHVWPYRVPGDSVPDIKEDNVDGVAVHTWEAAIGDFNGSGRDDVFEYKIKKDGDLVAFQDKNGNGIPDAFEDYSWDGELDAFTPDGDGIPRIFESRGPDVDFDANAQTFGEMGIVVSCEDAECDSTVKIDPFLTYHGNLFKLDWSDFDQTGYSGFIYRKGHDRDMNLNLNNSDYTEDNFVSVTLNENKAYYIRVAPIRTADASIDRDKETVIKIMRNNQAPIIRSPTHKSEGFKYSIRNVNIEFMPFHFDGGSVQEFCHYWGVEVDGEPVCDGSLAGVFNRAFINQGIGDYFFKLRTKDHAGALSETASYSVRIVDIDEEDPPTADFRATPDTGSPPLTVRFTDLSKGQIVDRKWDFDCDDTDSPDWDEINPGSPIEWTYTTPGEYTVCLEVEGRTGVVGDDQKQDKVINVVQSPPVARVAQNQIYLANMGDRAILDASPSFDPDSGNLFFSWREHHDNPHLGLIPLQSETLSRIELYFPSPGRYQFDVQVSDGFLMSEEVHTITVYVPGIKGIVGFSPSDALVRVPDAIVRVHNTATEADRNQNPVDIAISDSLGQFFLENIEPEDNLPGRYFMKVERPGFNESEVLSILVHPEPGTNEYNQELAIGRGYVSTLSGYVSTSGGGEERQPLENALISIIPGLGGQVFGATTDTDGWFEISDVPRGSWIMQLHAQGFKPEVRDVNVADNMPELQYTMKESGETGSLEGTVKLMGTESAIANAKVSLGTGAEKFTDNGGEFKFNDIPVGDYILTVSKTGYEPMRLPVVAVDSGTNEHDLFLSFSNRGTYIVGAST